MSSDHTAKIYDVKMLTTEHTLVGHANEISKVVFDSRGNTVITGSSDKTCRIWDVKSRECKQILEGHKDEIFRCAYNYEGNTIITASKDNTCRIWTTRNEWMNNVNYLKRI